MNIVLDQDLSTGLLRVVFKSCCFGKVFYACDFLDEWNGGGHVLWDLLVFMSNASFLERVWKADM